MFSYYGSKSKIVDLYQQPKYKTIIEPFAGSAKYAMKYWKNDVILIEKYEVVYKLWKWLQQCNANDILKLPILKQGDDLNNFEFDCEEAKIFMGYLTAGGVAKPQNKAVFRTTTYRPNWIKYSLERMSKDIYKIRHWDIRLGDYTEIENVEATWFIDPPYQFGGEHYPMSNKDIDYKKLAEWCKSRNGQAIVCENSKADWLPFKPMVEMQGTMFKTTEAIWSNHKTNYDAIQQTLQF
jgi:site-specific DNA-adenine methylase